MPCPMCRGETDPRVLLLETRMADLCGVHQLEAVLRIPTEADLRTALDEGARQAAAIAGLDGCLPGRFRSA